MKEKVYAPCDLKADHDPEGPYPPAQALRTWGAVAAASCAACRSCHSCCFHSCRSCSCCASWGVDPYPASCPPACRWGRHMMASCCRPYRSLGPRTGWGSTPWVHSCLVALQQNSCQHTEQSKQCRGQSMNASTPQQKVEAKHRLSYASLAWASVLAIAAVQACTTLSLGHVSKLVKGD